MSYWKRLINEELLEQFTEEELFAEYNYLERLTEEELYSEYFYNEFEEYHIMDKLYYDKETDKLIKFEFVK